MVLKEKFTTKIPTRDKTNESWLMRRNLFLILLERYTSALFKKKIIILQ